jgi:isopentenyl diphosphate isomerase/L-lactate dehydrogenase-like FMN-dependent dehydrogenase
VAVRAAAVGPARYRLQPGRLWYTWQYLDEIRRMLKVPLLVKGILTAEDATLCVEHGVDGIIVSNHGGRSMDYGPSTLEVLPEIVAAVNRRIPVITDSGYRRGRDILKALALGADAVLLGRATRWALGAFGAPGVQRLLEIVQQELVEAAAAAGRPTRASIDRSIVRTRFV